MSEAIKKQIKFVKRHRHELSAFVRSEFKTRGRGMLAISVDGIVSVGNETKTAAVYMDTAMAAEANPDTWPTSQERRMVETYDPKTEFVVHFVWTIGPECESRWNTFKCRAEIELNDEIIERDLEIMNPQSDLARRAASQMLGKMGDVL